MAACTSTFVTFKAISIHACTACTKYFLHIVSNVLNIGNFKTGFIIIIMTQSRL